MVGGGSIRWNPYTYAGANPINYLDPSGRFFFVPALIGFGIGGAMGGAFELASQMINNWQMGLPLNCNLDPVAIGLAMLEGGIQGAIIELSFSNCLRNTILKCISQADVNHSLQPVSICKTIGEYAIYPFHVIFLSAQSSSYKNDHSTP